MQKHANTGGHDPAMTKPYISGPDKAYQLAAVADLLDVIAVALTGDVDEDAADSIRHVVAIANMSVMSVLIGMEREGLK